MNFNIENTALFQDIINDENVFASIYSLESYIFEVGLLKKDYDLYYQLKDKYDSSNINNVIRDCKSLITSILTSDNLFEIEVYFKAKKYNQDLNKIEYRPMHSASLVTQICLVCLLNVIMFTKNQNGIRELSDISKLLPSNFYGNMPSNNVNQIFCDWRTKYKEYSENVIKVYNECKETSKYRYEVCLDLKNYFPSINPKYIYNMIINKLSIYYTGNEFECLKVLLKKLLYFNVTNINAENSVYEYYSNNMDNKGFAKEIILYKQKTNVGIPQGLPQSYFFGNLCMTEISQKFNEKFDGESFFYVDDSVIYTNSATAASNEAFVKTISDLNVDMNNTLEKEYGEKISKDYLHKSINMQQESMKYCINLQSEKSTRSDIQKDEKYGREYLKGIAIRASRIAFELYNTMDEIQDSGLCEKIEAIKDAIESEIRFTENADLDDQSVASYLKVLKRYKKFYLYRLKVISLRDDFNINEQFEKYLDKYLINKENYSVDDIKLIFERFDEDIFLAEAQVMINNCTDINLKEEIIKKISRFESQLTKNIHQDNLYFSKIVRTIDTNNHMDVRYHELRNRVNLFIKTFIKSDPRYQVDYLNNLIDDWRLNYFDDNKSMVSYLMYGKSYDKFIFANSTEYKRCIINAIISRIFNVDLNDEVIINRVDHRPLKYYELRILIYIRNKNIKLASFILFVKDVLDTNNLDLNQDKIDYSINEVVNSFIIYVRDPDNIDQLILVHKFVSGIWKNGSKFLYFYTLHNQEHSVELINLSLSVYKSIDYLQLKQIDFFILFLSCYLHDISMVLHPNLNSFAENNPLTDAIYSSWKLDRNKLEKEIEGNEINEKQETKLFIKKFYEEVSYYFESYSRENHVKDSAKFIKKASQLRFINSAIRAYVSNVSEAHGYTSNDVYGIKSMAKDDIISEKYLMIILRLADLMDISKNRVSLSILKQNIKNMPEKSKFHWISHAAIDRCIIKDEYKFDINSANADAKNKRLKSYLSPNYLSEVLTIELVLNTRNLIHVKSKNCYNVNAKISDDRSNIVIDIGREGSNIHCNGGCSFICKWMCEKNEYLIKELSALLTYLDRNDSKLFNTKINIKLSFKDTVSMPSEYIDVVKRGIQI